MKKSLFFLSSAFASGLVLLSMAATISPGGGTINGGGGLNSNQVYVLIQTTAPTNGGTTPTQVGTQIKSTNDTFITPFVQGVSNNVNGKIAIQGGVGNNNSFTNPVIRGELSTTAANGTAGGDITSQQISTDNLGAQTGTEILLIDSLKMDFGINGLEDENGNVIIDPTGVVKSLATTNGANTTNLLGIWTNGQFSYIIIGANLSYNATTRTLSATGGGGSQTPWTQNIDGGGFNLSNVGTITANTANTVNVTTTNLFDLAATNGAASTNLVGVNVDGSFKYVVVGNNLQYSAPTRTLSISNTPTFTQVLTPTNGFGGTVVDMSIAECITNMAGSISFSGIANATAGMVNSTIITMKNVSGSDQSVTAPPAFKVGYGDTLVVTNGFTSSFLFRVNPGVYSNMYQLDAQ